MPGRCYVAQEPRGQAIDLKPLDDFAKETGAEVHFIYSASFHISVHPREALAVAESFAAQFRFAGPHADRLVLAGGDPLAALVLGLAIAHEAREVGARSFGSLRFVRERNPVTGERTLAKYLPIDMPTGI